MNIRIYRILTFVLFIPAIGINFSNAQSADSVQYVPESDTIQSFKWTKSYTIGKTEATYVPEGYTLVINEFMASNGNIISDETGEFDDWIEIYNFGDQPVDLYGLYITDEIDYPGKWRFLPEAGSFFLPPDDYVIFWADGQPDQGPNHISFKLSSEGEEIAIFTPDQQLLIDSLSFPQQYYDVSRGREPNGGETWNYFLIPTPGYENSTGGLLDIVTNPQFSHSGGIFTDPIQFEIVSSAMGSSTHYTLDGSVPTESSPHFDGLNISSNTIFRARSFQTGYMPSKIITHTFLFEQTESLDVISLVSDSLSFWGSNGILTNRYSGIEKPVSIEYFKNDGNTGFRIDAGVEIHAPDGRSQQSLRLSMRQMYGNDMLLYQLFPDKPVSNFKKLVLRNAGNDGSQLITLRTHFRDPLMHIISSTTGSEIGTSAYKPVHVYINRKYWGIYNLRERIDKYYIQSYHGVEDIDLLERSFGYSWNEHAIEGDWNHFHQMKNFADTANLNNPGNYSSIKTMMDVNNFSEYWIYVVFFGNFDWLSNNMKFWRSRNPAGKWKWIHWDLDHGLGLPYFTYSNPDWNTLAWSTSTDAGRPWEGYNTILIRNLLGNEEFKDNFINRFADLLNSAFIPANLIPIVDSIELLLENDIPMQIDRWGGTVDNWHIAVDGVRNYLSNRPAYVWQHVQNKFNLEQPKQLNLQVLPENAGTIQVNFITVEQFPWNGKYFKEIPISIKAIPNYGYEFYGWNGNDTTTSELTFSLDSNMLFTAYFTVLSGEKDLLINEINYNSAQSFEAADWVEIYNPNPWEISLTGYALKDSDEDHTFIVPGNTKITPYGYFVISQDTTQLSGLFPDLHSVTGNLDFGYSSDGESVRLYNQLGALVDSVYYLSISPWPGGPDGSGATLELVQHNPENELPGNWQASYITGGTPGLSNSESGSAVHDLLEQTPNISIYPNPGKGLFYLKSTYRMNDSYEISVFNLVGRKVTSLNGYISSATDRVLIDLNDQPDGIYIIKVLLDGRVKNLKVVKSN